MNSLEIERYLRYQGRMAIDEHAYSALYSLVKSESGPSLAAALIMHFAFDCSALDQLFRLSATEQYEETLLFSTCFQLLVPVASNSFPSLHASIKAVPSLPVSIKAIYEKIAGIEPAVSESLVSHVASRCASLQELMPNARSASPLGVIEARIWDGNHHAATQHRLKEVRSTASAPLPGFCLVMLDPQRNLLTEVIEETDGHANERTRLAEVARKTPRGTCAIFDRNFCVLSLLTALDKDSKYFLVRQHAQLETVEDKENPAVEVFREAERTIYEQRVKVQREGIEPFWMRRITVRLSTPTRRGETEIHLLTNLPVEISAKTIADAYRTRWKIETAFQWLEQVFSSELETLGFPRAAMFSFCVAVCVFNVLSTVRAAIRSAHGAEKEEQVSNYYLAHEMQRNAGKIQLMLAAAAYQKYRSRPVYELANELLSIASLFQLKPLTKNKQSVKKQPTPRSHDKNKPHVATKRMLDPSRGIKSR